MIRESFSLSGIPAIAWGGPSDRVYIHVHGKLSRKEYAEAFAAVAEAAGWQTLSFDLPQHGGRADAARLDVWNGVRELNEVAAYAFARWRRVRLFACSIGAYFALNAYADRPFERALFQSPIADMEYLVRQMMRWFHVSEEQLKAAGEIDTPIDPLRWDYYRYILEHPVTRWPIPTAILYGARDELQTPEVMRAFAARFGCELTVSPDSGHPFMEPGDARIVENWLKAHILP